MGKAHGLELQKKYYQYLIKDKTSTWIKVLSNFSKVVGVGKAHGLNLKSFDLKSFDFNLLKEPCHADKREIYE